MAESAQFNEWQVQAAEAAKLCDENRLDDAVARAEASLAQHADGALALRVLGIVAMKRNRHADAIPHLRKSLALQPGDALCQNSLGHCYFVVGDLDAALVHFERAVFLAPDLGLAHFNRANVWMKQGRLAEGWLEYEWRWPSGLVRGPAIQKPRWDGGPIDGRTILVHTEQGIGDAIMGIRFLPLLKEMNARVVFACHHPLEPLLRTSSCIENWFSMHHPDFDGIDYYSPLWSLPRLLNVDGIIPPGRSAYVAADPERVDRWRVRVADLSGFKVGISWQGSRTAENDSHRSPALREFAPVAQIPGVNLVNLQKGDGEEQVATNLGTVPIKVFDGLDRDAAFVDTAAIIQSLDLVITCDTSIAHLAGAMGRPVWVVLSTASDWRWGVSRSDCPWYPSMRLFRQKTLGDWPGVFGEVAEAMRSELRL